eukprot:1454095-Pyramimonas_sp.AAC.1
MAMAITRRCPATKQPPYYKVVRPEPSARCVEKLFCRCVRAPVQSPRGQPASMPCEPFARDRLSRSSASRLQCSFLRVTCCSLRYRRLRRRLGG